MELEFANVLQLRQFRRQATASEIKIFWRNFHTDLSNHVYEYCAFDPTWVERAMLLARDHSAKLGTRTLDVFHVACALELKADILFTFDELQRSLAKAVHLRTN